MMYAICLILSIFYDVISSIELTFELEDNANQCFFEDIVKGTESTIEYQVITGGQYDIDASVHSVTGQELYKEIRKQYGSHTWKASATGAYKVCFFNEFSTFSHKILYLNWQVGDEKPIVAPHLNTMTLLEKAASDIHEKLKTVDDLQTHHRLRETGGRVSAENLHERVLWWSIGQSIAMLVIFIAQVMILKSFFGKRPTGRI